jgi:hypothetical protein
MTTIEATQEGQRLAEDRTKAKYWRRWGSYVSERQWGTVREDYSAGGNAWDYFSHDQARSRAYRWGEDGLAGLCDNHQRLCFALALWNSVLLLPRQHAHPLLYEISLQIPSERLPVQRFDSGKWAKEIRYRQFRI